LVVRVTWRMSSSADFAQRGSVELSSTVPSGKIVFAVEGDEREGLAAECYLGTSIHNTLHWGLMRPGRDVLRIVPILLYPPSNEMRNPCRSFLHRPDLRFRHGFKL